MTGWLVLLAVPIVHNVWARFTGREMMSAVARRHPVLGSAVIAWLVLHWWRPSARSASRPTAR